MSDAPQQQPLSLLSKRAGPLSLRGWLFILLVALTALYYFKSTLPNISNAEYVQKLIDKGALARTAGAFIRDVRPKAPDNQSEADKEAEEAKWKKIAGDLSICMEKEAKAYLASGDPSLQQRFSRETPGMISKRLMAACGALKYLPPKKKE
jgi:hypothetical protein